MPLFSPFAAPRTSTGACDQASGVFRVSNECGESPLEIMLGMESAFANMHFFWAEAWNTQRLAEQGPVARQKKEAHAALSAVLPDGGWIWRPAVSGTGGIQDDRMPGARNLEIVSR